MFTCSDGLTDNSPQKLSAGRVLAQARLCSRGPKFPSSIFFYINVHIGGSEWVRCKALKFTGFNPPYPAPHCKQRQKLAGECIWQIRSQSKFQA